MSAPPAESRPATSTDVAKLAGLSRATVSRILNGDHDGFPESTRERVREAARTLRYRPSPAGRSLVSGRSDTIVVLLPNTTFGSNLQDAVDEVAQRTRPLGGNVVVRFASPSAEATVDALEALRPLAVVNFGVLADDALLTLRGHGVIVVPDRPRPGASGIDGGVAALQASRLADRGFTHLTFGALRDERQDPYGVGRFTALSAWCEAKGMEPPGLVEVPLTLEGGRRALEQLLAGGGPVGVVCYNDDVAVSLLAAARDLHVAVPEQVGVVGVDHTPTGQLWLPRLTTVHVDFHGLVDDLAQALEAQVTGRPADQSTPVTDFLSLVPGETA